jgi:hypothetical protein
MMITAPFRLCSYSLHLRIFTSGGTIFFRICYPVVTMLMSLRIRFSSVSFLCAVEEDQRITVLIPVLLLFSF